MLFLKFGTGIFLVFLGVLIGILSVVFVLNLSRPDQADKEEISRQYVIDYTKSEEARLGIDCGMLRKNLKEFLETEIHPVLELRKPGQGWDQYVSEDLRKNVEKQRDYYLACGRLYTAGRNGEWNGLTDLGFSIELDKEFVVIYTLIRFGAPDVQCDASCLDRKFHMLQEAVTKIDNRLAASVQLQ